MKINSENLMNAVLGKMYEALTGGDGQLLKERKNFFTWCTPGIPVQDSEFDFMDNLIGHGVEPADKERDTARRLQQAENFAALVDFIPDPSGIFDEEKQANIFNAKVGTLSGEFARMLRFSKVVDGSLTEEEKTRVERFQNLLKKVVTEEEQVLNMETGLFETNTIEKVVDSPLTTQYKKYMSNYEDAALAYNMLRINALKGDVPGSAVTFAINGPIRRRRVEAAMDEWIARGYKNQFEQISAYIAHVTQRDMTLVKRELEAKLAKAVMGSATGGNEFYYTSLVTPGFAKGGGWTQFEFNTSSFASYANSKSNAWGAKGGLKFGGFRFGASASGSKRETKTELNASNFTLTFELTQVPISRAWFAPEFIESRAWDFTNGQEVLSDGKKPPKGTMIAYPTSIIFARNVVLDFDELHDKSSSLYKSLKAGGSIGWGPFHLGGSYKRGESERSRERDAKHEGIKVDGMQIVGFKNHLIPKAPNPMPDVEKWV